MAEGKQKIIFYREWVEQFRDLSDDEAGRLIKHIMYYVNDEDPEAPDRLTELLFKQFKQAFKRDLKKWEAKSGQAQAAARKRWGTEDGESMRTHADASKPMRKNAVNVKDKVKVNVNTIPREDEFLEYAIGKKPDVDPQSVKLKYHAWVENEWRIPLKNGTNRPIKNWKTTLLNTLQFLNTKEKSRFGGLEGKNYM